MFAIPIDGSLFDCAEPISSVDSVPSPLTSTLEIKMNRLSFFVLAPAWQIFSLMILPLIFTSIASSMIESMVPIQLGMFVCIFTMLLWIYSVCTLINEKYSSSLNIPIIRLKICLSYNFIYSIFFSFGIIPVDYLDFFHIIAFCSNIYCLYFLAKVLVMVEKKSKVNFNDYIGTFFAVYILIFGIWVLQPRINRIFLSNNA